MTTLEEVFLKIAHEDENVNLVDLAKSRTTLLSQKTQSTPNTVEKKTE